MVENPKRCLGDYKKEKKPAINKRKNVINYFQDELRVEWLPGPAGLQRSDPVGLAPY